MRKKYLSKLLMSICLLVSLITSGFSAQPIIVSSDPLPPVIVLTGQSNMKLSSPYIDLPGYQKIDCSRSGSSVSQWQRGELFYNNCLQKVEGRNIAGIFHFQGERDSYNASTYSQWSNLTLQFFNDFREDTDSYGVKIVYAQIGTPPTDMSRPYWRNIQRQQARLYELDSTLRRIVTYDITPYCPAQGPHFCPNGYQIIADRFEDAFLSP